MSSICSPNFLHKEIALAAAAAGKPFWIEKPMGVSADESADIARAAAAAGVVTSVGFNYRHAPAVARARQLIRDGALGRITNIRVWLIADYASAPEGPLTWRYDRARAGSGVVGDLMSHGLDLAQFLVGRVASVTALSSTFITERPIPTKVGVGHGGFEIGDERGPVGNEDYVGILARFDNGVVGTLESSRVSIGPRSEYAVEVTARADRCAGTREDQRTADLLVSATGSKPEHGYTTLMAGRSTATARFQPGPASRWDSTTSRWSRPALPALGAHRSADTVGCRWLVGCAAADATVESAAGRPARRARVEASTTPDHAAYPSDPADSSVRAGSPSGKRVPGDPLVGLERRARSPRRRVRATGGPLTRRAVPTASGEVSQRDELLIERRLRR
jgi:predicted dehydrogenase